MKKNDILLIIFLFLLSLLPVPFLAQEHAGSLYAEISMDGKPYQTICLSGHQGTETICLQTAYGSNVIEIKEQSISVIEADCPDGTCRRMGTAQKSGDTIACLPHKLLIEIKKAPAMPIEKKGGDSK